MKRLFYALLLLCLSWVAPSKAQQSDTTANFSLKQAIAYAQKHHVSLRNATIDQQIAKNTVKKTTAIGLPQISGNASFQDFLKIPTSLLPGEILGMPGIQIPVKFGSNYTSSIGLELSQLIFDGSYLVGLQASKTYRELANKNYIRSQIETTVAVSKAYYSVLVSTEQLGLLDANLLRLKKALDDTKALFKNGFVEKIDLDRLTVLNNNLNTERENVIRLLALNLNLLKFQMGMTINSTLSLTDKIEDIEIEKTPILSDTLTYKNRIEYTLLKTQYKLSELDMKRYKSQYFPSLIGFGSTSINFQNNKFADLYDKHYPTTIVGLRLSVPIFSSGQRLFQVRNAKLEMQKTANNLIHLENAINLEILQAQTVYLNGQKSLNNQKGNMELAKEVLRVARVKYEQGVGSSLEVITAETALKEAQNNYITALYDLLISKVNLEKATGKINY